MIIDAKSDYLQLFGAKCNLIFVEMINIEIGTAWRFACDSVTQCSARRGNQWGPRLVHRTAHKNRQLREAPQRMAN